MALSTLSPPSSPRWSLTALKCRSRPAPPRSAGRCRSAAERLAQFALAIARFRAGERIGGGRATSRSSICLLSVRSGNQDIAAGAPSRLAGRSDGGAPEKAAVAATPRRIASGLPPRTVRPARAATPEALDGWRSASFAMGPDFTWNAITSSKASGGIDAQPRHRPALLRLRRACANNPGRPPLRVGAGYRAVIDYVFTFRMAPRKVRLRMLKRTGVRACI